MLTIGILAGAQSGSAAGIHASPGQWLGSDMTGGQTHHVTKGDVFVIPAGIPHWFKDVPRSVSYFVVKVLKP